LSRAASDTLQKVCDEFLGEVLAELDEGLKESSSLVQNSKKEAEESVAKITEAANKQAESLRRQILGTAELEARNMKLRALEKAVNGVFQEAIGRVAKAPPSRYEKSLTGLIREGVQVIGPEAHVACSERDRRLVSSIIERLNEEGMKLTLGKDKVDTLGGVVLYSPDGTIRFDNTVEARLERTRPELRKDVAALLSG
jgi:V/A-type H+-transporting ATPase subunit E